ncbi:MAG: hypothetical protein IJZ29_00440 [Clostridia bacterium]|nr:hypothetical protein [Clostridia bacterium]
MEEMKVFDEEVLYSILKGSVIDGNVLTISKDIEVLDGRIARIIQAYNIKHIKFDEGSKLKKLELRFL